MDEVYGDLENYNDVNLPEELRKENLELKQKIEENAIATVKLQRDFDELASEFKKLQMNYSSLLKTARAEIERKTQTIINLNKEKDAMILNAIQNQSIGDFRRGISKYRCVPQSNNDLRLHKKETDYKSSKQEKTKESENKNLNSGILKQDADFCDNKYSKSKDYSSLKHTESVKPSSVHSRRKSMTALRCENKFDLSEDEYNPSKQYERRNSPLSRGDHRPSRPRHRGSKGSGSSADDKYSSYKESSLETFYRSRDNRYYDCENRKSRHRYEINRDENYSPDRLYRKATRHTGSQHNEIRHRENIQESRYAHRSKSHDRRTYYDTNYDRDYYEGHKRKHKIQDDCDDYRNKRMKYSPSPGYLDERVWQQETHYTDEELLQKVIGDLQYTSCQSPDIMSDYPAQPIREIKLTADVPLEDPRIKSRRYSVHRNEEKVVLSTVDSQEINLKHIDKHSWNLDHIKLPDALQHPPEVQEISGTMQILKSVNRKENAVDHDDLLVEEHTSENITNDDIDKGGGHTETQNIHAKLVNNTVLVDQRQSYLDPSDNPKRYIIPKVKTSNEDKTILSQQSENHVSCIVDKAQVNPKCKLEVSDLAKSIYENINPELNMSIEEDNIDDLLLTGLISSKTHAKDQNFKENAQLPVEEPTKKDEPAKVRATKGKSLNYKEKNNTKGIEVEIMSHKVIGKESVKEISPEIKQSNLAIHDTQINITTDQTHSSQVMKLSNKEIVAGDLELSDETNDNQDFLNHVTNKLKKDNLDFVDRVNPKVQKGVAPEIDIKVVRILSPGEENKSKGKEKSKRTRLSTKKSPKAAEPKTEKKTKQKKVTRNISTPIKKKFSDLFGDSSSLITPEDLGMGAIQVTTNYEPFIEDAQDGLDIKDKPEQVEIAIKKGDKVENKITPEQVHELKSVEGQVCNDDSTKEDKNSRTTKETVHSVPLIQFQQEPDVVKTIIISTGMQPQIPNSNKILPDGNTTSISNETKPVDDRNTLIALATSTPHKMHELTMKLPEDSCNSNDSRSSSNSHSIASLAQATDDIPDVRIFLKRKRRRVIKKT